MSWNYSKSLIKIKLFKNIYLKRSNPSYQITDIKDVRMKTKLKYFYKQIYIKLIFKPLTLNYYNTSGLFAFVHIEKNCFDKKK